MVAKNTFTFQKTTKNQETASFNLGRADKIVQLQRF